MHLALIVALAAPIMAFAAAQPSHFVLASRDFANGATLPASTEYSGFGCTGANQPPELHWSGVPAGTKSFALTMHDPDAPAPGGWWHWVVFNVPATPSVTSKAPSLTTMGVQGTTSFGKPGYGGPCPPPGKPHHYVFTLYALDLATLPGADSSTNGPALLKAIKDHVLAKATLTGLFGR